MLFGVSFSRLFGVSSRLGRVSHCGVRMMGGFLVIAGLVVLGRFAMVAGGMRQMLRCFLVMFGGFFDIGSPFCNVGKQKTHPAVPIRAREGCNLYDKRALSTRVARRN